LLLLQLHLLVLVLLMLLLLLVGPCLQLVTQPINLLMHLFILSGQTVVAKCHLLPLSGCVLHLQVQCFFGGQQLLHLGLQVTPLLLLSLHLSS